jgi:hypothetical protein
MNAPATNNHDRLQVFDTAQISDYAELSRAHAARGDARLAVLAMWAADLRVLQGLLWESGLGSAPDPHAQLGAVAQAVGASLSDCAVATHLPMTPREAVERARQAMVGTFDQSVHPMLVERMGPLDHLDSVPVPLADDGERSRAQRLAGRTTEELVADLRVTAGDCMAVAVTMADEGDLAGAISQARQADLASFEAYLVAAAVRVGDGALATVDLRWALAEFADRGVASSASDLEQAVNDFRGRLVDIIGPGERPGMSPYFEPVSPGCP